MGKSRRWIACSCNHGDMADEGAVRAFFDFVDDFKPEVRIHLGDAVDLRWLRSGATDAERKDDVGCDVEAACSFLSRYDPTVYLWGNHETRLNKGLADRGPIQALCEEIITQLERATPRARRLPYCTRRGVYRLGDLSCIHGFSYAIAAPRKHGQVYGNCIAGHGHGIARVPIEAVPTPRVSRMIGCLCLLDMGYDDKKLGKLTHQHGFAYGTTSSKGTIVWQAEEQAGQWNIPH